jgi:multidrug resistance protein MdtO
MAANQTPAWLNKVYQELAPAHGRYEGALRTALAATLATYVLLVLQTPMIAPGVYLIYLVSYDVPYLTFKTSVLELFYQCFGVALSLMLIAVTGNDPMARVLGVAGFTFLSAFLIRACTVRVAAMNLGIFPILTLSLWELHLPAEQLVHLAMFPVATGAVAVAIKVAIEYIFARRDPNHALQAEMKARLEALQQLFEGFAAGEPAQEIKQRVEKVSRYAFAGQGKMLSLLEEVRTRAIPEDSPQSISPALIPYIARLLDVSASFARQHQARIGDIEHPRFGQIAAMLAQLLTESATEAEDTGECEPEETAGLLSEIEQLLYTMKSISRADRLDPHEKLLNALPRREKKPWFRPGAWSNPEYLTYAAKLSLCATLCYIVYNSLAWPGASTATLTVLVAGVTSSGATNQKMLFRILGATIGGIVFGIGCIVFVYPFADSALPFLLSVALVSFIGAWIARSAHLGYVGLQIVFSFYLVAFQEYSTPIGGSYGQGKLFGRVHGFGAPLQMNPARDRVMGVLIALFVMWAIFHQLHPKRVVDRMRLSLARLLRMEADLISLIRGRETGRVTALREDVLALLLEIRGLAEAIPFELDRHVARDTEISEDIQQALTSTEGLFLHARAAWPRADETPEELAVVKTINDSVAQGMREMANMLDGASKKPESGEIEQNQSKRALAEVLEGGSFLGGKPPESIAAGDGHSDFSIASLLSTYKGAAASPESLASVFTAYTKLQKQILKIQADA